MPQTTPVRMRAPTTRGLPQRSGFSGSFAARQDFNDNFDDQSIWKVGLRQDFGYGLYARGSGGTSYSLPKIDEIGAFGSGANINPGLQPQEVSAFNVGAGIDGDIFGGTYNVEIGYFETEIKNLFSSRAVGAVCYEYANDIANPLFNNLTNDTAAIERNRQNIVPPNDFCATAAAGLNDPGESVAVNAVAAPPPIWGLSCRAMLGVRNTVSPQNVLNGPCPDSSPTRRRIAGCSP